MGKWKAGAKPKAARRWRVKTLIKKYDGKCAHCNVSVIFDHRHPKQASVDHIVPLSKSGTEDFKNLQLLCRKCNNIKGDTILDDDGEVLCEE